MNPAFENLEKLSQDLYQKLINDAEAEIAELQEKAAAEREKLLHEAKAEAEQYRKNAEREIELHKERKRQELQQAALQLKSMLKKDLQDFLKESIIQRPLANAMQSESFIQTMIIELLAQFNPSKHQLIWPANWNEKWLDQIRAKLPEWTFKLDEQNKLLIRESEQGLEFHFSEESFQKLLESYFDRDIKDLILRNDWVLLHPQFHARFEFG